MNALYRLTWEPVNGADWLVLQIDGGQEIVLGSQDTEYSVVLPENSSHSASLTGWKPRMPGGTAYATVTVPPYNGGGGGGGGGGSHPPETPRGLGFSFVEWQPTY